MADTPEMITGMYSYTFYQFTVFFHGDHVYVGGKEFPTGQLTVDVVNTEEAVIARLRQRTATLLPAVRRMLGEKTDSAISSAQEKLNAVWNIVFTLPPYRDLNMDEDLARRLFFRLRSDGEKWAQVLTPNSPGQDMLLQLLTQIATLPERLHGFREQIRRMTDRYFEPLPRRNAAAYAEAYSAFYAEMLSISAVRYHEDFQQSFPLEVSFVPMRTPDGAGIFLAEKATFNDLLYFLRTEFYRGLALGNAPRRCHNCGRYFLLTEGYNTCYCNDLAPGETERTCRKVGAHRKEAREKASATPAQKEYAKAYNRLKARKQRGKISVDEWNAAVARAQELKERSERGELSDEDLRKQLAAL